MTRQRHEKRGKNTTIMPDIRRDHVGMYNLSNTNIRFSTHFSFFGLLCAPLLAFIARVHIQFGKTFSPFHYIPCRLFFFCSASLAAAFRFYEFVDALRLLLCGIIRICRLAVVDSFFLLFSLSCHRRHRHVAQFTFFVRGHFAPFSRALLFNSIYFVLVFALRVYLFSESRMAAGNAMPD